MNTSDNTLQAKLDGIEDNRIEASLRSTFAGDVERLHGDDGKTVWGWAILGGRVMIPRGTLPVDFSGDVEGECHAEHRQEILDIVRAAYVAGRAVGSDEAFLKRARAM